MQIGTADILEFASGYLLIAVSYTGFYLLISKVPRHSGIISCYVKLCVLVSLIGIFQYFSYLTNFRPGYDFSDILSTRSPLVGVFGIRLASILSEPSHVASCLGPAICLAVYTIFGVKTPFMSTLQGLLVLVLSVLSGSTVVYLLISLSFLTIPVLRKGKVVLVISILASISFFYSFLINGGYFDLTVVRVADMINLMMSGVNVDEANASSYSVYIHFVVAANVLFDSLGFGGGIGSHALSYERVFSNHYHIAQVYQITTAGGLFNRLISEIGVLGIGCISIFVFLFFSRLRYLERGRLVLHFCFSICIVGFLVRQGTFSQFGFPFYLLMFILLPRLMLHTNR